MLKNKWVYICTKCGGRHNKHTECKCGNRQFIIRRTIVTKEV